MIPIVIPSKIDVREVKLLDTFAPHSLLGDSEFFREQSQGIIDPMKLPAPAGVTYWRHAEYRGSKILFNSSNDRVWFIADSVALGVNLFQYIKADEFGVTYKAPPLNGNRFIKYINKGDFLMQNLNDLIQGSGAAPAAPLNLNPGTLPNMNTAPVTAPTAEGVKSDRSRSFQIESVARKYGYVAGYIVPAAPRFMIANRSTNGTPTLTPCQTKPGRPKYLMVALPRALMYLNGGTVAKPEDILEGRVDVNAYKHTDLVRFPLAYKNAIHYIAAVGGSMTEYAPTCADQSKHWTPEEISSMKEGVSFVAVRTSASRKGTNASPNYYLKSTSNRGSLYTAKNIFPLSVYNHIDLPATIPDEKTARDLNENAFGYLRYRYVDKNAAVKVTKLQDLISKLNGVIWSRTIETENGPEQAICSAFFLAPGEQKDSNDNPVKARPLTYVPWTEPRASKNTVQRTETMTRMVKRTLNVVTKDGNTSTTQNFERKTYKSDPSNVEFGPYNAFRKRLINEGFVTDDALKAMCGRTSKSQAPTMSYEDMLATLSWEKDTVNKQAELLFSDLTDLYTSQSSGR